MKLYFLFILFAFLYVHNSSAQDNETMAKSSYLNAESSFNQDKFSEAWDYTGECIKYLGRTSLSIQYLRVKICLAAAVNKPVFWDIADFELESFFALKKVSTFPDEKYNEMIEALAVVKTNVQKAKDRAKQEEASFKSCLKSNNLIEYTNYLKLFPDDNGDHKETVTNLKETTDKIAKEKNETELLKLYYYRYGILFQNNEFINAKQDITNAIVKFINSKYPIARKEIKKSLLQLLEKPASLTEQLFLKKDMSDYLFDTTGIYLFRDLAYVEFQMGNCAAADKLYAVLLRSNSNYYDAYYLMASMKQVQLDYRAAIEANNKLLELSQEGQEYPPLYDNLADCKMHINDFAGAEQSYSIYIEKLKKITEQDISDYLAVAYISRAEARLKQNKYKEALTDYTESLKDKENPRWLIERGKLYLLYLNDTAKAYADFRNSINNHDSDDYSPFALFYLGKNALALDRIEKRKVKAVKIDSKDEYKIAIMFEFYYDYARLLSLMNKKAEALEALSAACNFGEKLTSEGMNGLQKCLDASLEDDFKNIKSMPAFIELIENTRKSYLNLICK